MSAQEPTKEQLERDIFGGDSDLSDIESETERAAPEETYESPQSESEDETAAQRGQIRKDQDYAEPATASQAQQAKSRDEGAPGASAAGKPKQKRRKRAAEDGEGGSQKKRRRSKKATPPPESDEDKHLTPEERRKRDLERRLDAIIKKPKAKKKKRAGEEEDLGQAADEEEILRLRSDMLGAAKRDIDANADGKPAIHKLKMLPQVTATLQKSHLELIALDQGILSAMREWLEPLPDKSLPALNIQRALFNILVTMNIDTASLKESYIGKIILFYSRCQRVDPSIRRTADLLITNWMRPLLRRSSTWRDRPVARAEDDNISSQRSSQYTGVNAQRTRLASLLPGMSDSATGRRHARIPAAIAPSYTIAPGNRIGVDAPSLRNGASAETLEKFKNFNKQLKTFKRGAAKA